MDRKSSRGIFTDSEMISWSCKVTKYCFQILFCHCFSEYGDDRVRCRVSIFAEKSLSLAINFFRMQNPKEEKYIHVKGVTMTMAPSKRTVIRRAPHAPPLLRRTNRFSGPRRPMTWKAGVASPLHAEEKIGLCFVNCSVLQAACPPS